MVTPKFVAGRALSASVLVGFIFILSGCANVSPMIGVQIPLFKHGSISVGVGAGGVTVGAGVHAGPVSVGVNSNGAVTAGVGVNVGGVGVTLGGGAQLPKTASPATETPTPSAPAPTY